MFYQCKGTGSITGYGGTAMARILLADDEEASRVLVCRALESDGHAVQVAESGTEADDVLAANAQKFDLLITDINMPGMTGLVLAKTIRARQLQLPIILMSGLVEQLESVDVQKLAPVFTIPKPFTLEQMRQIVRTVTGLI
jgi:two-component system, cell cycle response regulator CpdR